MPAKNLPPKNNLTSQFLSTEPTVSLIIGLGNVGPDYTRTWHNVGFMLVDELKEKYSPDTAWKTHSKAKALTCEVTVAGQKFLLAKPTTMMNLSGEAVGALARFYKLTPEQIAVAHDDLDIDFGNYKVQLAKAPVQHNGLESIDKHLGSNNYWHIRIGVETRKQRGNRGIPGMRYVLQRLTAVQLEHLQKMFAEILD